VSDKSAIIVARQLREQIASGDLKHGDLLPPEAELIATLGVSRPVVREALRLLENEQLLTVRRGALGGARVDSPSYAVIARYASLMLMMGGARIEDVFGARTVLELEAIRLLAIEAVPETVDRLRARIGDEEEAVGDNEEFGAAYDTLNEALIELCPNPAIKLLWHTLDEIMTRHRQYFVAHSPVDSVESSRAGVRAHRRTINFIAEGKADGAQRAWSRHREASTRLLLADGSLTKVVDLLE
jgi:DNA-binding FadR family transcriptional regulator